MTYEMSDEALFAHLSDLFADDRPPADAVEAAYAAFGWRTLDADLAELLEDSQVEVVMFRQGSHARLLSYECEQGAIELGVDDHAFELMVRPGAVAVVVHRPWGSSPLELDADGRAAATEPAGPIRFGIVWESGSILTPWTTL
ncbi:MAG: hypothetical protein AAFN30_14335 [Actinomycetota bacterium]